MPRKRARECPVELSQFGARLRYARELRGMTGAAVASAADSHGSMITKIEKDGHLPDAATIYRIAQALGVSVGWLLAGEEPMTLSRAVYIDADGARALGVSVQR